MRLSSASKNGGVSGLGHEEILRRRDANEAISVDETSSCEDPKPAKKPRTSSALESIITDVDDSDDMAVEVGSNGNPPFVPPEVPAPFVPTLESHSSSTPSVLPRRRLSASPAQAAETAKFIETLKHEMKNKKSRKGQKGFGYSEDLFAAVLDAMEAGWENITKQKADPSKLLKFKTAALEPTTLRQRAVHLGLPELFENIFGPLLDVMLEQINAEATKRATRIVGDDDNAKAARSRLREFEPEEHRQCFAFNIVYLALTARGRYKIAWKDFRETYLAKRTDDSGKPRKSNIGRNRAETWRSCLAGVKLNSVVEALQEAVLATVIVGVLMAIDESLFAATALLFRFWENSIQKIERKPHSVGHLVYMGVLLLQLSHLPLAAFFVPYIHNGRTSPSDAFLDIIRRRYRAALATHIHAIGDSAFSTTAVVDDILNGVSTDGVVVDGTFSTSGVEDQLKLAMVSGLLKNQFRVFYNRKTGCSMVVIHATDKAGKGHFVFRMSTAFSPDGKDIEPRPEPRYSPRAIKDMLAWDLKDLKRLAVFHGVEPSGSPFALVGRICNISVPAWLQVHGGASTTTENDELVLTDDAGVSTSFSISSLKGSGRGKKRSPCTNDVLKYLFEKYGLGPHGNRKKDDLVDRMVYIAKKKTEDPALIIESFCGPTCSYVKGTPKETQMPFAALLYKAFFNLQDRLNHFYTGIRIPSKYMNDNAQRVGEMLVVGLVDLYSLNVEVQLAQANVLTREKVVSAAKPLDKEYPIKNVMNDLLAYLLE